jgi:hypothetical protein
MASAIVNGLRVRQRKAVPAHDRQTRIGGSIRHRDGYVRHPDGCGNVHARHIALEPDSNVSGGLNPAPCG